MARPVTDEGYWSTSHDAHTICPSLDADVEEEQASGDAIGDAGAPVRSRISARRAFSQSLARSPAGGWPAAVDIARG